jgi:uncharacterized membrane protein
MSFHGFGNDENKMISNCNHRIRQKVVYWFISAEYVVSDAVFLIAFFVQHTVTHSVFWPYNTWLIPPIKARIHLGVIGVITPPPQEAKKKKCQQSQQRFQNARVWFQ